jgi:hypothetical protein
LMTSTESSTEQKPIIDILRGLLQQGDGYSRRPDAGLGSLYGWALMVRTHLGRIYGKQGPLEDLFPLLKPSPSLPNQLIREEFEKSVAHLRRIIEALEVLPQHTELPVSGKHIFIGHGRSPMWRELKDFVADRLQLPWDEFNREAVAGYTTSERLQALLSQAAFAFLVMTAEEEHADATVHARPNVIHEVGLFQGRLGMHRAIVLLEEGCSEFSNIVGLSQIRFPKGDIAARFEEVRRVLEREGLI